MANGPTTTPPKPAKKSPKVPSKKHYSDAEKLMDQIQRASYTGKIEIIARALNGDSPEKINAETTAHGTPA